MSKPPQAPLESPARLEAGDHFRCDILYVEYETEGDRESLIQTPGRFGRSHSGNVYGRVPRLGRLNPNRK